MAIKIYCISCTIYLGSILEGSKLKKGIAFLCNNCNNIRKADNLKRATSKPAEMPEFFKDIFGGKI